MSGWVIEQALLAAEDAERYADTLIEIAVRNGPRAKECGDSTCDYCDQLDPVGRCREGIGLRNDETYCIAARALGIL